MTIDEARTLVALHGGTAGNAAMTLLTEAELTKFSETWPIDSNADIDRWNAVRLDRVARIIADRREQ